LPELPEVETVRRVLEERLVGLKITSYEVGRPTFYRKPPQRVLDGLVGSTVEAVRRRGKYLLLALSGGAELTLHLGMSGRIVLGGRGPHTRFQFTVEGQVVSFHDARRFGRVGCELPEFGPEPLSAEFTAETLFKSLRKRRAPVKAMLMDQGVVAGLGNIYATEALFAAGIRPGRAAGSLSRAEASRLCAAVKSVLAQAVELGGSTLEDAAYLDPLGRSGSFQEHVSVYGRKVGRCGHALRATRKPISGRTSLYCPVCQK
jgi:formamidopyrimidine-DNA glycosylase